MDKTAHQASLDLRWTSRDTESTAALSPLTSEGIPSLSLQTVGVRYFDWHHTDADTVDKIKPEDLRLNIAAMAVMTYILADMPERLTTTEGAP